MAVFQIVIALLLGGAVLAAIARRLSMPYPALVAIAGAALALSPRVPSMVLDPELALALFVAPVLLDAAFDASQRDLRQNWRAVAGLAFGAVALTVGVVAVVAHALVPGLPWAAAIALGAIVAPPDRSNIRCQRLLVSSRKRHCLTTTSASHATNQPHRVRYTLANGLAIAVVVLPTRVADGRWSLLASNPPSFLASAEGLYLHPPAKALILCCDEKSQCQALERTQPGHCR